MPVIDFPPFTRPGGPNHLDLHQKTKQTYHAEDKRFIRKVYNRADKEWSFASGL
jgi:hypothetical protein